MMRGKFERQNEKYKICLMAILLAGACVLTYYFHVVLGIGTVFTHFFYIPIILACLWWKKKGLVVAVFLVAFLILSHIFFRPDIAIANDCLRAFMFIVIAFVVAKLSEHITRGEEALQAVNQQLRASEQQLKAANQQLRASEQQLRVANQQLRASEQQLKAANQQLHANEQQLRAANQQLRASERQLLDDRAQLKSLASQLTLAEESERHRIATELHTTISQSLVVSKLQLDTLRASAPLADIAKMLGEVCELLDETIQGTRSLTFDLSSPILYELGFEKAVAEWLTERIQQKHRIATEFEDDGQPKPLDEDVRVFLFRDVRELLINVVKHAQAKKVKVSVRKVSRQIQVRVEDDGVGFDPEKVAATAVRKGGFGLFSIRERLEQLGGQLEIESARGQGCRVTVTAPLRGE